MHNDTPLVSFHVERVGVNVDVSCYGPPSWRIATYSPRQVLLDPKGEEVRHTSGMLRRLRKVAPVVTSRAIALNVSFRGNLLTYPAGLLGIPFGKRGGLSQNLEAADIFKLPPSMTFLLAIGGCPGVLAIGRKNKNVLFAHVGGNGLVGPKFVADTILSVLGGEPKDASVWILFGSPPTVFPGDAAQLLAERFRLLRVGEIDATHGYVPPRALQHPNDGRNLIAVSRST